MWAHPHYSSTKYLNATELYECDAASGACSSSKEASGQLPEREVIDMEELPTREQMLRDYDPSVQHLDAFLMRHFHFPALEQLVLRNCLERYHYNWSYNADCIKRKFLVRFVRHLTRFRESDAPDSQTRLRLVDLRCTNLYEEDSAVRLMRLLAPHVEFIADFKPDEYKFEYGNGGGLVPVDWYYDSHNY